MTGEEWLVKKVGAYLPGAYEEVVDLVPAIVLTEKVRLPMSICLSYIFYLFELNHNENVKTYY